MLLDISKLLWVLYMQRLFSKVRNKYLIIVFLFLSPTLHAKELVFLLAGQSNMVGQGTTSELAPEYHRDPSNVSFYFNGYKTSLSRFKHFGPEIGFAHEIAKSYPNNKIKLIKFAVGGTSMFAWHPQWNAIKANSTRNGSAGALFKKLIKTAKIPFDENESKFVGILWMQGEQDAKYPVAAKQYASNLNSFVSALRHELKAPEAAFIMGVINPPVELFPATAVVQNAQNLAQYQIRNCHLVKTADLSKRNDHLHYNTQGQLELGKRFAKTYSNRRIALNSF